MTLVTYAGAVTIGYLLGAIPVGVLVCRLRGTDPRLTGSGRTGGTNVYRTAGLGAAAVTGIGDVAKGTVAVAIVAALTPATESAWAQVGAALGAIAGHNYSVFLRFRGGAGTSPNLGALLALDPVLFLPTLLGLLAAIFATGIASLASLTASLLIVLGIAFRIHLGDLPPALLAYALGQLALVTWALRPNIARLRAGTERRVGLRPGCGPTGGDRPAH